MTSQIIPPLEFFNYSPYSMQGTSLNNGKLNSAFFNNYKSIFGPSTNISLNSNPTKFSNDTVCSTCNKFAALFLNNTNGQLSNRIGNQTAKISYQKLEQLNNVYNLNGITMYNIYDKNLFNFGTLICNCKTTFKTILDINGNYMNGKFNFKIIYADGYYDYLNQPIIDNIQNELTIEIIDGIRKINVSLDPSGLYTPSFISNSLTGLIPTLYLPSNLNSTFQNLDLQMEEFNLSAPLFLDNTNSLNIGEANILSTINKNVVDNSIFDGLFFNLYSVNNSSPLVQNGNILGLTSTYIYQTGSVGYIAPTGLRYAVIILYADADFDFLNYNDDPSRFNTFVIEINGNGTFTLFIPPKPKNYVPPNIVYPENLILQDKIIYNKFYSKQPSNSSVFDNTIQNQNITLFCDLYDTYDEVTGVFGKEIGKLIVFNFILNKNNQTYTSVLCYFSFFNEEYMTSIYVIKNGLDKNGALTSGTNLKSALIASSDGYKFNSYFVNIGTFKNNYSYSVGYI